MTEKGRDMKIRNGFVANSSSSCYILSLENEWSRQLLEQLKGHVPHARGLGRGTSWATGENLAAYADDYMEYEKKYGYSDLGSWIREWIDELGSDKTLFVMKSDEGMGGYLPVEVEEVLEHSLSSMEHH